MDKVSFETFRNTNFYLIKTGEASLLLLLSCSSCCGPCFVCKLQTHFFIWWLSYLKLKASTQNEWVSHLCKSKYVDCECTNENCQPLVSYYICIEVDHEWVPYFQVMSGFLFFQGCMSRKFTMYNSEKRQADKFWMQQHKVLGNVVHSFVST
jgi:hypothetical protein